MTGKELKAKLKRGELVLGTMVSELRTPQVGQLMANAGFDFMYIDMEHSPLNMETVADMILGARYAGIATIVRTPGLDRCALSRPLDAGADGVLVPQTETKEEVEKIVEVGEIAPDDVHLPGIYVHRIVLNATPEKRIEQRTCTLVLDILDEFAQVCQACFVRATAQCVGQLADQGVVAIADPGGRVDRRAVLAMLTVPVEVGVLELHPRIAGVRRSVDGITVDLELSEVLG